MGDWIALFGFALGGLISLGLAGLLFWVAMSGPGERLALVASGLLMCLLAGLFFVAVRFFRKEIEVNLIRRYLQDSTAFEFVTGEIVSGHYIYSKNGGRTSVEIEGPRNSKVIEHFKPSIWPFTTKEADEQLQEGDDWYDMKGKRPYLPVKVYLLQHPKLGAALVGIDKQLLNKT